MFEKCDCGNFRSISEKEDSALSTIVVRGSTDNIMDDIERSIDDGVNSFKALTRDARLVPGAGATEIELAHQLNNYGQVCKDIYICVLSVV